MGMAFQADCVVVWKVDVVGGHDIGKRAVEKIAIVVFISDQEAAVCTA